MLVFTAFLLLDDESLSEMTLVIYSLKLLYLPNNVKDLRSFLGLGFLLCCSNPPSAIKSFGALGGFWSRFWLIFQFLEENESLGMYRNDCCYEPFQDGQTEAATVNNITKLLERMAAFNSLLHTLRASSFPLSLTR